MENKEMSEQEKSAKTPQTVHTIEIFRPNSQGFLVDDF